VDVDAVAHRVGTAAHRARAITDATPTLLTDAADLVPLPRGSVLVTGYGATTGPALAERLTARGHAATAFPTGTTPDAAAVQAAVARARTADTVVVLTSNAWTNRAQQGLVAALQTTGKPVLVVAVGVPYDIAALPGTQSYVATYSYQLVALDSLARLLAGEITPRGKLPVDIPSPENPDTVVYPFGSGLTS